MPEVPSPVRRSDLFRDQLTPRFVVRYPQERLGKAHECDTLVRAQGKFLKEALDQSLACRRFARITNEFCSLACDRRCLGLSKWAD